MNKGLIALEELRQNTKHNTHIFDYMFFDIIEEELKEYDGAKAHIEALHKERIETSIKLQALEIIKKKGFTIFDLFYLKNFSYEEYRRILIKYIGYDEYRLKRELKTKEEFEILREVML